jgi:hypothetical protein
MWVRIRVETLGLSNPGFSKQKGESLLGRGVEVTSLPGYIANASAIHEAQDSPVEKSQEIGDKPGACLAYVFSQRDIAPKVGDDFQCPSVRAPVAYDWSGSWVLAVCPCKPKMWETDSRTRFGSRVIR